MGFGSSSALLLDPVCLLYMSSLDVDKESILYLLFVVIESLLSTIYPSN